MRTSSYFFASALLLATFFSGCGKNNDDKSDAPPPAAAGDKHEKAFALQSGDYMLTDLTNLQDKCGKNPMAAANPITSLPFTLTNDSAGNVTMNFCNGGLGGVHGTIKGNTGTLAVEHAGRKIGDSDAPGVFDQTCSIDVTVTADNTLQIHYTESQSNRNKILRASTVDLSECVTSFDAKMVKKAAQQ